MPDTTNTTISKPIVKPIQDITDSVLYPINYII